MLESCLNTNTISNALVHLLNQGMTEFNLEALTIIDPRSASKVRNTGNVRSHSMIELQYLQAQFTGSLLLPRMYDHQQAAERNTIPCLSRGQRRQHSRSGPSRFAGSIRVHLVHNTSAGVTPPSARDDIIKFRQVLHTHWRRRCHSFYQFPHHLTGIHSTRPSSKTRTWTPNHSSVLPLYTLLLMHLPLFHHQLVRPKLLT